MVGKKFVKYSDAENCPVRNVLDRIGDKWSVLVIMVLNEGGVLRFNELHKYIQTISQKMLSVTLKSLEQDNLISRTIYPQVPPRVEYQLTDSGKSLVPHLKALVNWASDNLQAIKESRSKFERIS